MQTSTTTEILTAPGAPPALLTEAANSPTAAWRAATANRSELQSQLETLTEQRHGYLREIEDHGAIGGPAVTGMHQRITQLDARINELDKAIAVADANVANTAAIPGAVVTPPRIVRSGAPEEAFIAVPVVLMFVMMPLVIAYARRIWRRPAPVTNQLPSDLGERLARLEQMGETTALEVERIGEGQRFVTRLLTDRADHVIANNSRG